MLDAINPVSLSDNEDFFTEEAVHSRVDEVMKEVTDEDLGVVGKVRKKKNTSNSLIK